MTILQHFQQFCASGKKGLAVLLDPDKLNHEQGLNQMLELINSSDVDFVFVGGSLIVEATFHERLQSIRSRTSKPIVLFPGSPSQISAHADALLFLSLISGRNADLLIGQHVAAAPLLKKIKLEAIATGYMLVDCGKATTASYISHTLPLPYDKPEIAAATAMAGELLGLKCMYLDGGSGAAKPISSLMIHRVKKEISVPLIVGGGIRSEEEATSAWAAGADIIVVGTAFEEEPELLFALCNSKPNGRN